VVAAEEEVCVVTLRVSVDPDRRISEQRVNRPTD